MAEFTPENYKAYLKQEAARLASGDVDHVIINTQVVKDEADEDFLRKCNRAYIVTLMNRTPEIRAVGRVRTKSGYDEDRGASYLKVTLKRGEPISYGRKARKAKPTVEDVAKIIKEVGEQLSGFSDVSDDIKAAFAVYESAIVSRLHETYGDCQG